MKLIGCEINIKSFDSNIIEYTVDKIKRMAFLSGIVSLIGPIRFPLIIKR